MDPAFSSTKEAGAFALLLLVLLALPLVLTPALLPPREEVYASASWTSGDFPYLDEQIYREKGDIDIAFMGPSRMWTDIDTPYVARELSKKLGRPAVVRTFSWTVAGYDALYFITKDLLQHRKVHLLVYYDAWDVNDMPHYMSRQWFRFGDDAGELTGLSWKLKLSYYLSSIMGMPRNLLALVRTDRPADFNNGKPNSHELADHTENIVSYLGAFASKDGYDLEAGDGVRLPYEEFQPKATNPLPSVFTYSDQTKEHFHFTAPNDDSWQYVFARKFVDLARQSKTSLVMLHVPIIKDGRNPLIEERRDWSALFNYPIAMVGIPPEKLWEGISDADRMKLYRDSLHLNKNGQDYFTPLVTPTLLDLYETATTH